MITLPNTFQCVVIIIIVTLTKQCYSILSRDEIKMSTLLMRGGNGHMMQDNIEPSCLSEKSQSIHTNDHASYLFKPVCTMLSQLLLLLLSVSVDAPMGQGQLLQ